MLSVGMETNAVCCLLNMLKDRTCNKFSHFAVENKLNLLNSIWKIEVTIPPLVTILFTFVVYLAVMCGFYI